VAGSQESEDNLRKHLKQDLEAGHPGKWLNKKQVHELEPALAGKILGAVLKAEDGEVDPGQLTRSLKESAEKSGAKFLFNTVVEKILVEDKTAQGVIASGKKYFAKHVVVAAGAWSGHLDPAQEVDVEPVRGQALHIPFEGTLPIRHIVFGKGIYLVPRDGGISVGATHEHVGYDKSLTVSGIAKLTHRAIQLIPRLGDADWKNVRAWSGLRPGNPQGNPIIGPAKNAKNLWWATGHYTHGILLAPITAKIISEGIICQKETDLYTTQARGNI